MTNVDIQAGRYEGLQAVWGWKVAVYLFLAGAGSGAFTVGATADFLGRNWGVIAATGLTLGPLMVLASSIFLVADLGVPMAFLRAGARPRSSWISRGVYILTGFVIVGLIVILLRVWPLQVLVEARSAGLFIEGIGLVLAVLTMIYTGLLLSAVKPIPFWNTAMLPVLFLLSAVSTGMMAVLLVVSVSFLGADASLHHQISSMVRADVAILVLESLVIFFYLYGNYSSLISRPSASLLLAGDFALLFWAGFVASGLAVPLIFELTHWSLGGGAGLGTQVGLTVAASVSGLFGGLILRYLIIAGGVRVPIQVAGMMVTTSGKARL